MSPENEAALEAAQAVFDADTPHGWALKSELLLAAHIRRLVPLAEECERLREGKLTPDEFQNLCHNLQSNPDLTPEKFFDGCAVYQTMLFGRCERDQLAERVKELEHVCNTAYMTICGALVWAYDPCTDAAGELSRALAALLAKEETT